jgi:pyrimidine nucleoside transport protein
MGVEREDAFSVARLLAKKVFINEFVSYQELGAAINFREEITRNGTFDLYRNGTYSLPFDGPMIWNEKSTVIITYALCGFSSFCSLGICIGALS